MTAVVDHKGDNGRLLSPKLWGPHAPIEQWAHGIGGYYAFDDFRNTPQMISAQNVAKYASYIDTGVTIKQNEDEYGVLEFAGNDADNDEGSIIAGGNTGGEVRIVSDALKLTIFEARLKKASIANNALAFAIGLGAPGYAAADALVDNTGALKDDDFIGFHVTQAAGGTLTFTYRASGQTAQVPIATLATLTADTYFKVGFRVDPNRPPSQRITVVYNNTEQGTFVTQANIEAATFPEDVALARVLATKVGEAAESKLQLDWWALGQKED